MTKQPQCPPIPPDFTGWDFELTDEMIENIEPRNKTKTDNLEQRLKEAKEAADKIASLMDLSQYEP